MIKHVALIALLTAMSLPAFSAAYGQQGPTTAANLNENVCETLTVVGSRLGGKRVCATGAEWQERKRLDREAIDHAQRQIVGPCQTTPSARNGGPTTC